VNVGADLDEDFDGAEVIDPEDVHVVQPQLSEAVNVDVPGL
jgi:hypothetical protein